MGSHDILLKATQAIAVLNRIPSSHHRCMLCFYFVTICWCCIDDPLPGCSPIELLEAGIFTPGEEDFKVLLPYLEFVIKVADWSMFV